MRIENPVLLLVAVGCLAAVAVWGRSALRIERSWRRLRDVRREGGDRNDVAADLARSAYRKDVHTTLLYLVVGIGAAIGSLSSSMWATLPRLLVAVPVAVTLIQGRRFVVEAALTERLALMERRAEEVLTQDELAPRRWAARLAPEELPDFEGFEVGHVYEAGTGLMAGDFYDVHLLGPRRLAAAIGDVSGHGIEPSITAFQVKYLLRVFLRQYRDPAQALEELNNQISQISAHSRPEEFVSLCVAVIDLEVGTVRYASAGHPPAWLWHDEEVRPLPSTGPMLTIDPRATFSSREIPLDPGDILLLYTDGLAEARAGGQLFGDDRVAQFIRRDPRVAADVLCKSLLAAARDFATTPLRDDVAILAVRRV